MMLTIGEVAARTGLRPSAIRYYEAKGLLPTPARRHGRRVYPSAIVGRLGAIQLAKSAGFHLDEIATVLSSIGERQPSWRDVAATKDREILHEIDRLTVTRMILSKLSACTCASLEECGHAFFHARDTYAAARTGNS